MPWQPPSRPGKWLDLGCAPGRFIAEFGTLGPRGKFENGGRGGRKGFERREAGLRAGVARRRLRGSQGRGLGGETVGLRPVPL